MYVRSIRLSSRIHRVSKQISRNTVCYAMGVLLSISRAKRERLSPTHCIRERRNARSPCQFAILGLDCGISLTVVVVRGSRVSTSAQRRTASNQGGRTGKGGDDFGRLIGSDSGLIRSSGSRLIYAHAASYHGEVRYAPVIWVNATCEVFTGGAINMEADTPIRTRNSSPKFPIFVVYTVL